MLVPSANPLAAFSQSFSVADYEGALLDLLEKESGNPLLSDFLTTFQENDGDIRRLLSRTHEPVGLEEFVTSDYFLNLRIVNLEDEQKDKYGGGLWSPVFDAVKEIVDGGFVESIFAGAIGCVDAETEYLTPFGWQPIAAYKSGVVAQFNEQTGRAEFVTPSAFVKRPCKELWHFKTKYGIDQMLSDGHRVYYKAKQNWFIRSAGEIAEAHNHSSFGWRGKFATTFKAIPAKGLPFTDAELRALVMCAADGSYPGLGENKRCVVSVAKQRKVDRARELLTAAEIMWTEPKAPTGFTRFHFTAPIYLKAFRPFMWEATEAQLAVIAEEVLLWDGNKERGEFYTNLKESADFVQYAFTSCGFRSRVLINVREDGSTEYAVNLCSKTLVGIAGTPKTPIERVASPDGFKYCFEVPTGLLVFRRNGNIFITGNTGKTSAAQVVTAYNLYRLSCEVSPHMRFNIIPKNDIYYVMLNVTDDLAYNVTFKGFRGLLENSPYFTEVFPYDKQMQSFMRFPKKIIIAPFAAFAKKIMGMDVMGGIVDELNFMQQVKQSKRSRDKGEFKQAVAIYNTLVRRVKARFDTDDVTAPVSICLVSSKAHHGDFTETREKEAAHENEEAVAHGRRPLTYFYNKAQWEAKPDPKFHRGTPFQVEIGDGRFHSRILRENDIPRAGAIIREVPEFFLSDFERDPEGAIADFIGVSAGGSDSYFWDKVKIWNMNETWEALNYSSPFLDNDVRSDQGWPRANPDYVVPNPERPRAAHIDLALSGDCVGIAVGHVYKVSHGAIIDRVTGKKTVEAFPHVAYDQVLVVRPPRAGQIELAEIRSIVYFLRDEMKIPIRWVTYDGFESADSRQILRKQGFKTDRISVENREAYGPFRTAMFFHERLACATHERVFTELSEVSEDVTTGKIDHPSGGSKDGADGMVGVFTMLMRTPSSWKPELMEDTGDTVVDAFSEKEKEILGEWADKPAPRGSIAARIQSRRQAGGTKRRTLRRKPSTDE